MRVVGSTTATSVVAVVRVTDGNATTANGDPLFTIQREVPGQGATIFTVNPLDINLGLYYQMYVIASNKPLNATQIANWNGTRLDLDINIVDIDNNGPSFDAEPPGRCSGIGKTVERGTQQLTNIFTRDLRIGRLRPNRIFSTPTNIKIFKSEITNEAKEMCGTGTTYSSLQSSNTLNYRYMITHRASESVYCTTKCR